MVGYVTDELHDFFDSHIRGPYLFKLELTEEEQCDLLYKTCSLQSLG